MKNSLLFLTLLLIGSLSYAYSSDHKDTTTKEARSIANQSVITASSVNQNDDHKTPTKSEAFWQFLKGTQPDNAIYLGMLTWHFNPESRAQDRWSNNLIGGVYNSIFVGTLLNSFSERAFVVGVQRKLYTNQLFQDNQLNIGYRLGLISGYDERMSDIAKYLPILPIPELYIDYAYRNFGAELSYIGVVFTAKFFIRF